MSTTRDKYPITHKTAGLGSGLYGGRPTFSLRTNDGTFTLYELLPTDQAIAHKNRWKANRKVSKTVKIVDPTFIDNDEWEWSDWQAVKITNIDEARFETLRSLVKDLLEMSEYEYADLLRPENEALLLPEAIGVKLALAFIGIKPLRRIDKQRACIRQIEKMSIEECYYWHSICRSPNTPNGGKALRTLLAGHIG